MMTDPLGNDLMLRRTYDAVQRAKNLFESSGKGCKASLGDFERMAIEILQDDPKYIDYLKSYKDQFNIENLALAQAIIKTISEIIFGGEKKFTGSSGERLISKMLDSIGIKYEREKVLPGLVNVRNLRLDFFLPEINAAIEYHGKQHFSPIDFFGGEESLRLCKARDEIKRNWCLQNNIRLIEICFDEDAESVLIKFFNSINYGEHQDNA